MDVQKETEDKRRMRNEPKTNTTYAANRESPKGCPSMPSACYNSKIAVYTKTKHLRHWLSLQTFAVLLLFKACMCRAPDAPLVSVVGRLAQRRGNGVLHIPCHHVHVQHPSVLMECKGLGNIYLSTLGSLCWWAFDLCNRFG